MGPGYKPSKPNPSDILPKGSITYPSITNQRLSVHILELIMGTFLKPPHTFIIAKDVLQSQGKITLQVLEYVNIMKRDMHLSQSYMCMSVEETGKSTLKSSGNLQTAGISDRQYFLVLASDVAIM